MPENASTGYTAADAASLLTRARSAIEGEKKEPGDESGSAMSPLLTILMQGLEGSGRVAEGDQLHSLLAEAREIYTSDHTKLVLHDLLDAAFATLEAEVNSQFELSAREGAGALPPTLVLSKIFAKFAELTKKVLFSEDLDANPFVSSMEEVASLKELSAMIYSAPFAASA